MATPNNTISPGLHPPGQQLNANEEEEEMCFVVPKQTKREPVSPGWTSFRHTTYSAREAAKRRRLGAGARTVPGHHHVEIDAEIGRRTP